MKAARGRGEWLPNGQLNCGIGALKRVWRSSSNNGVVRGQNLVGDFLKTESGTDFRGRLCRVKYFSRYGHRRITWRIIPNSYRGREQSYIKHKFLTQYLQTAAYKILQGRSPIFNFFDAIAGPWRVSDEDDSDASFDQALRTLETVGTDLTEKGIGGLKIRFCLCERQATAVDKLVEYAKSRRGFDIHVFPGSFEDNLDDIAAVCCDGFTFSSIDPTGWNIRSEPILKFLKDRRGEFLLNFVAEHVNRHAEYSQVEESFGRFLADPDWSDDYDELPPDWGNEKRILHLLRRKIKVTGAATYVPDIPILRPSEQRVKMRLLLGT